jgi:hypothetical protein
MDEIRFSVAARRHGVSRASVLYVMGSTEPEEHPTKGGSTGYFYRGRDAGGREIGTEVTAKPDSRPPVVTSDTPIGPDVDLNRDEVRLADGTRLTSELADAINEDVRHTAGRPSLSGRRKHSPQVSARITPELQAELKRYSKHSGLSTSQVLRHALERLVGGGTGAGTSSGQKAPENRPRHAARKDSAGRS